MMKRSYAIFALPAVFIFSMSVAVAEPIDELAHLLVGDFDNRAQYEAQFVDNPDKKTLELDRSTSGASPSDGSENEPLFSHLGLQRRLVSVPTLGGVVIYAQINRRADPTDVYRQSLQHLKTAGDGSVKARNYRFTDNEKFKDILENPARFAQIDAEDLAPALPTACDPLWRRENGTWVSRIDRESCVIVSRRDGKPRHIQATEFVTASGVRNEESGYTSDGEMIFGLPEGVFYQYDRLPSGQDHARD